LAALVDLGKIKALDVNLGEPTKLEGFTIRLPEGWSGADSVEEGDDHIEIRERHADIWARTISVSARRPSLTGVLGALMDNSAEGFTTVKTQKVNLGGADWTLITRRAEMDEVRGTLYAMMITIGRTLPDGRYLSIILSGVSRGSSKNTNRDVELLKRIAASVEVTKAAPATQQSGPTTDQ
jgi:hypothetical protein